MCNVPHAARNVALLWAAFCALLLLSTAAVHFWFECRLGSSVWVHAVLQSVNDIGTPGQTLVGIRICSIAWFLVTDVAYFLYSQITDIAVIYEVLSAGHELYGFILMEILLGQYPVTMVVVMCVSVKAVFEAKWKNSGHWTSQVLGGLVGFVTFPLNFFVLECGMWLHGLHIALPAKITDRLLLPELATYYRLRLNVESLFNALPQSIMQSRLYLWGNTSMGVDQYVSTKIFMFSVLGSLASDFKAIVNSNTEMHRSGTKLVPYTAKVFTCVP